MLHETSAPLLDGYDLVMLDLDGVVYIGGDAVPDAPEHLRRAREAGRAPGLRHQQRLADARTRSRTTCVELGVAAEPGDVVTSAQAAARVLAERLGAGAQGVPARRRGPARWRCEEEGLEPVESAADDPVAVVTGYGPDVLWRDIMRGAVLIRDGLPWVASNTDLTIPTADGVAPGHGVLVQMLAGLRRRRAAWWPASRSGRCSTRPYGGWAATAR